MEHALFYSRLLEGLLKVLNAVMKLRHKTMEKRSKGAIFNSGFKTIYLCFYKKNDIKQLETNVKYI